MIETGFLPNLGVNFRFIWFREGMMSSSGDGRPACAAGLCLHDTINLQKP